MLVLDGVFDGAEWVAMVPAASQERALSLIWLHNADTAAATVTLELVHGSTSRQFAAEALKASGSLQIDARLWLPAGWWLRGKLLGAPSTSQPTWLVNVA